jgi:hypothetical protein
MPRPLSDLRTVGNDETDHRRDLTTTRRTSRSFAAAVAVLLLATLVANRTSGALTRVPANAAAAMSSGTIELNDDDGGRSLFDIDALTPARPIERCIDVRYSGSILPADLRMKADADGPLRDYLDVTIDSGSGGNYDSCDGFEADDDVFAGTLAEFVDNEWTEVGTFFNTGDSRTFRITMQLQDRSEALGQTTNVEFGWEATPS